MHTITLSSRPERAAQRARSGGTCFRWRLQPVGERRASPPYRGSDWPDEEERSQGTQVPWRTPEKAGPSTALAALRSGRDDRVVG